MIRMRPPKLSHAIRSLQPNAQFSYDNGDYNTLKWYDDSIPKPTEEECNTELARLQAEFNSNEYQRDRTVAYPPIDEQLDTLYHKGLDGWKNEIFAVKNNNLRPGTTSATIYNQANLLISELSDGSTPTYEVGTVMISIDEFVNNNTIKCRVSNENDSSRVLGVFSKAENGTVYIANRGNHAVRVKNNQAITAGCLLTSDDGGFAVLQSGTTITSSTIGRVLSTATLDTYSDSFTVLCNLTCG